MKRIKRLNEQGFLLQSAYQVHHTKFRVCLRHVADWELHYGEGDTLDSALDTLAKRLRGYVPIMRRRTRVVANTGKKRVRLNASRDGRKRRVRL